MKKTLIIISSIAALGGIYLFFQKRNKIPFSPVRHKLAKLKQGRYQGKDEPKKVALYLDKKKYEKNIAPSRDGKFKTTDLVIVSGTNEFDGTYPMRAKWTDKDGKIGAVWIDVDKTLGEKNPSEEITKFDKGKFAIITKDNFAVG
jgi:hypothetical protein